MAKQLDYDSLKDMTMADYKKAFKEKSQWKKAKAIIFMLDYKLGGKKMPIAIPIKKPSDLKKLHKQIKADKHPGNKIGGGSFAINKGPEGLQFQVDLTVGGLDSELLAQKGGKLFQQWLKAELVMNTAAQAAEGVVATAKEVAEQVAEETSDAHSDQADLKSKIQQSLQQVKQLFATVKNEVVPKVKAKTIEDQDKDNVNQFEQVLKEFQSIYQEANPTMQIQLQKHKDKIDQKLLPFLEKVKGAVGKVVDPEKDQNTSSTIKTKEEALSKMADIKNRVEKILARLEA